MPKQGLLLLNLGTPKSLEIKDIKNYLREFLMDPFVIDIARPFRDLLVKGLILNTRPPKTQKAYAKIWDPKRGSPLLYHSQDLLKKLQAAMAQDSLQIELAMRYSQPSVAKVLEKMKADGVDELFVIPLYPQYSLAASETGIQEVQNQIKKLEWKVTTKVLEDFYKRDEFLDAFQRRIQESMDGFAWDYVLFSYHGLPVRHLHKSSKDPSYCQSNNSCCAQMNEKNQYCYRAQSFETSRQLAKRLGLKENQYSISFQSRLGSTPWIQPFTDQVIPELVAKGVKNLLVACPSFVADCLETLEEIQMRAADDFKKAGGRNLELVPSLNASPAWVKALESFAQDLRSQKVMEKVRTF